MKPDGLQPDKEYRLSKGIFVVGLLTAPSFAAMGIGSVIFSVVDESIPHPVVAALLFGCFWTLMTALGLWILLAYLRERVIIGRDCFRIVECLQSRNVPLAAVSKAVWKPAPTGGMLVMFTMVGKVKIYFGNYEPTDGAELIQYFRTTLAADLQENWVAFESRSA